VPPTDESKVGAPVDNVPPNRRARTRSEEPLR